MPVSADVALSVRLRRLRVSPVVVMGMAPLGTPVYGVD